MCCGCNFVCGTQKNVSDFVQKHFVSATNVSKFARARKRHEQQCVRNNVSSFATALSSSKQRDPVSDHLALTFRVVAYFDITLLSQSERIEIQKSFARPQ